LKPGIEQGLWDGVPNTPPNTHHDPAPMPSVCPPNWRLSDSARYRTLRVRQRDSESEVE
jgi:hypothetical protein